jgi:hypothetical protein
VSRIVRFGLGARHLGQSLRMTFILWLIAVVLVVLGIAAILRREVVWGAVLIIVGLLVGPGGVSVFA